MPEQVSSFMVVDFIMVAPEIHKCRYSYENKTIIAANPDHLFNCFLIVINVLNRDRKYAREFIIRNADKLLFGTDEGWWSLKDRNKQMKLHYTFFEELNLPDDVRYKIYRGNAEKLFGWKQQGKD